MQQRARVNSGRESEWLVGGQRFEPGGGSGEVLLFLCEALWVCTQASSADMRGHPVQICKIKMAIYEQGVR